MPGTPAAAGSDYVRRALAAKVLSICRVEGNHAGPILSAETMRVCTGLLSKSPAFKKTWYRKIGQGQRDGNLSNPRIQIAFKTELWNQFEVAARELSSVVPFDSAFAYFYPNEGIVNWWSQNKFWYVKELIVEGNAGLISGERGFGKTDFALLLCEIIQALKADHIAKIAADLKRGKKRPGSLSDLAQLSREGRRSARLEALDFVEDEDAEPDPAIVSAAASTSGFSRSMGLFRSKDVRIPTNISISPKDDLAAYFQPTAKMSDICRTMCRNAIEGYFSFVVLDEMGFSFNKRRATTVHNFGIEQLLIVIRKFNAALAAIAQSVESQLPESLAGSSSSSRFVKTDKTVVTCDVRGLMVAQKVRAVPPTSVTFATRAFAPFSVDMVPAQMVEHVAELERIAREDGEDWSDEKMYRAAIAFIEENKASDSEISSGKSGILRSEIRYALRQIDPETRRPFSKERVATELGIEVAKVEEVVKDMAERARKAKVRREKKREDGVPVPLS